MKKTVTHKRYKTTQYNSRHFRLDLLDKLKGIADKSGDTVEGAINRALAIGVPLLADMVAADDKRTRDRKKTTYSAPTSVA